MCTTGCAGYGAVLARRTDAMATVTAASNTAAKTAKQQKKQTKKKGKGTTAATDGKEAGGWYLEVEVLDTGTGGFSLGLCAATLQKPFKSLGNNPLSWVWHADGSILHNRGRSEPPASETAVRSLSRCMANTPHKHSNRVCNAARLALYFI